MSAVSVTLAPLDVDAVRFAAASYIAGYSCPSTRQAYRTQLSLWLSWCEDRGVDPIHQATRTHLEVYARELEAAGRAPATVALKLTVVAGW